MKKSLALILSALLLLSLAPSLAQEGTLPPEAALIDPPARAELVLAPLDQQTRSIPQTTDTVVISGDSFTITSKGVTATMLVPFGLYAFSQDVKQQLDDYIFFFKDPRAAMEYVIGNDLSLFLMDPQNGDQLMYYVRQNDASLFFKDLQEEGVQELAVGYFTENAPEGHVISEVVIKGRNFIRSQEISAKGTPLLIYFTYVNGFLAGFQLDPAGQAIDERNEALLLSLAESAELGAAAE